METPESTSTPSAAHADSATLTAAPSGGEQTEDEAEEDGAVELPPPMEEIHTHPLATQGHTQPPGGQQGGAGAEQDVAATLVSSLAETMGSNPVVPSVNKLFRPRWI